MGSQTCAEFAAELVMTWDACISWHRQLSMGTAIELGYEAGCALLLAACYDEWGCRRLTMSAAICLPICVLNLSFTAWKNSSS